MYCRRRVAGRMVAAALLMLLALAAVATARPASPRTVERSPLRPRIGHAMGIVPPLTTQGFDAVTSVPVAFHGGGVMRNVTIHTVFWAPAGFHFDGSPSAGVPGYQPLIEQFLGDVAHDSGSASNVFSVLDQYGDRSGVGAYHLGYDPASDGITDTDPYPPRGAQCPSPAGAATCVTDTQLQQELDKVIGPSRTARSLSNLWVILLPPDVDTCTTVSACATNAYAGYHSMFDAGHGATVYAVIPDPLVELTPAPGSDPQGNPEAESAVDTIAHEAVESITDPKGTGWMDPNGFETGDKCESGPQQGAPVGYAADGSPYNQVIGGHEYLLQDMWSDARGGCVQSSSTIASVPPLQTIDLRQFSPRASGRLSQRRRLRVTVILGRGLDLVATARTTSRADGSWGPVTLRGRGGAVHAVGDDRDQIEVLYGPGRGTPVPDYVATGDGGNPFTESGYTGWYDLDSGFAVLSLGGRSDVIVGPCAQTGVLSLRVGAGLGPSPTDLCQNAPDAAVLNVPPLDGRRDLTLTSEDNRGEYFFNPNGTLVRLTIALGEPNSVGSLDNPRVDFAPSGFPECSALLRIRTVRCDGLVPGDRYRLVRRERTIARARAGGAGAATFARLSVHGGNVLALVNGAGRRLTALHVAHLRVDITGNETIISSGACQPGDYWGPPVTKPPISTSVGGPIKLNSTICPSSGRAHGLPTSDIAQTDDFSGGQTQTSVPLVESTAPIQDETLYAGFLASAQSGLPGPHGSVTARGVPVALSIRPAGVGRGRVVFRARNVDTARGAAVPALAPGAYIATWVLHDAAGDTRTVTTRFTDEA